MNDDVQPCCLSSRICQPAVDDASLYEGLFDCGTSLNDECIDYHQRGELITDNTATIRGKITSFAELLLANDLSELRNELEEARHEVKELSKLLSERDRRVIELEGERMVLQKNISCLYRTAVSELARKNEDIKVLRKELSEERARIQVSSSKLNSRESGGRERDRSPLRPSRQQENYRDYNQAPQRQRDERQGMNQITRRGGY